MIKVIIVGARRRRQGIGEFLAKAFSVAGAEVVAVVGTTPETAELAKTNLFEHHAIDCVAYDSLALAIEKETPDIVAICTPFESHLEQLQQVLDAGVHCLCEKPIIWGAENNIAETKKIVDGYFHNKQYLSLVTQWPFTLDAFNKLYPQVKNQPVTEFEMTLSPIRPGPDMVLDAAPHLLSMLQALVGNGKIHNINSSFINKRQQLNLIFDYQHLSGNTSVRFTTTVCEEIPRPASYTINGCNLSREIELPDYNIWFNGNNNRVPAEDPLNLLAVDYLEKIKSGCTVDRQALMTSIEALDMIYTSVSKLAELKNN